MTGDDLYEDGTDPTALPLFMTSGGESAQEQPRPVRSRLRITDTDTDAGEVVPLRRRAADPLVAGARGGATSRKSPAKATGSGGVDWSRVAELRKKASSLLSERIERLQGQTKIDDAAEQELGRTIILELVEDAISEDFTAGRDTVDVQDQMRLVQAVFDAVFRLGRLQPLVDDELIENIMVIGCDNVWLEMSDGRMVRGDPIADTDEELIEFLIFLAGRSGVTARPFSPAIPRLHMKLEGGSRLAATAWVTARPSMVIRRHRLREIDLADLVRLDALDEVASSFLRACVRTGKNIVVSGEMGAGKTTMVRALAACIPPFERIGTIETEYELFLHEMTERHPIVVPWEARPGSGERGADGRPAGEFTVAQALLDSYRFNLSRLIVGEVRGPEILAMLESMQSGTGSISTTHASDARAALPRLVTAASQQGGHMSEQAVLGSLAQAIDVVVHMSVRTTITDQGAIKERWVGEILWVTPGERQAGFAGTSVFKAPPGGGAPTPGVLPDEPELLDELERNGFDQAGFVRGLGRLP